MLGRGKFLSFAIICLSIALIFSAASISHGIIKAAETISYGIQTSSDRISNANNPVTANTSNVSNVMSLHEVSDYLRIPEEDILKSLNDPGLNMPYTKINNSYAFSKSVIGKWLEMKHVSEAE